MQQRLKNDDSKALKNSEEPTQSSIKHHIDSSIEMHITPSLSTSNKLSPRDNIRHQHSNIIQNNRKYHNFYGHGLNAIESKTRLLVRNKHEDSIFSEADMDMVPGSRVNSQSHLQKKLDWQKNSQRVLVPNNASLMPDISASANPHQSQIIYESNHDFIDKRTRNRSNQESLLTVLKG